MTCLDEVRISGLGVISEAVLVPAPGLTVVTGETGAGKTMVITALDLVTGGRAASAKVRRGSERAVVEARWSGAGQLAHALAEVGGELDDDDTLITVRTVSADGRSRAHIGGRSAPVAILGELTAPLASIHGQAQARSLLQPAQQRAVLDAFAEAEADLDRYRQARKDYLAAAADLDALLAGRRELALRADGLRAALAEIAAVAPLPGEDADLRSAIRRLENTDALRSAADGALQAVSGTDVSADAPTAVGLADAARRLLDGVDDTALAVVGDLLEQASSLLGTAGAELSGYLTELDADPAQLANLLARQAVLRTVERKYGSDTDAVLAWAADAQRELADLDTSDDAIQSRRGEVDRLRGELSRAASVLSARRRAAATSLGAAASAELADLAMGRAHIVVHVWPRTGDGPDAIEVDGQQVIAGLDGTDGVEIQLVAHHGAPALPLAKGASGGELSRVMLALEVVLAGANPVGTMVFDEVDAGIGGRVATEVGRRLYRLSRHHQVIVVTHLPQVACFADRHFVVDAGPDGSVGTAAVHWVQADAKVAELARMLGSQPSGDGAASGLSLAQAMLDHAQQDR